MNNNDNDNNNNDNIEILVKSEPPIYTRAWCAGQENKKMAFTPEQYKQKN